MTRAAARRKRTQPQRDNTTLMIAGVIAAIVVVALLVLLNVNLSPAPSTPGGAAGKTWGQANAPVTIDMWSDFQ